MRMKSLLFVVVLVGLFASGDVFAQFPMDKETFIRQAKENLAQNENSKALFDDAMQMMDVNADKLVSENEMKMFIDGISMLPNLTDSQKENQKKKAWEIFAKVDTDKNKQLNDAELNDFMQQWADLEIERQFMIMDRNGDGVWDDKDAPPLEESLNMLKEGVGRLQAAAEQLNNLDGKEFVDNMIKNITQSRADEDFFQMDKDKNACVSRQEYAQYQFSQDNLSDDYKLSYDDYLLMYNVITKQNNECLTKEEYVTYMLQSLDNLDMPMLVE